MAEPLRLLGSCHLGASTFCVKQHGADECDAKGLPLTLNTTNIMGRFERLKVLSHPHLAVYLDAKKLKHGSPSWLQLCVSPKIHYSHGNSWCRYG